MEGHGEPSFSDALTVEARTQEAQLPRPPEVECAEHLSTVQGTGKAVLLFGSFSFSSLLVKGSWGCLKREQEGGSGHRHKHAVFSKEASLPVSPSTCWVRGAGGILEQKNTSFSHCRMHHL